MKDWMWVGVAAVAVFLLFFFLGTRPAPEKTTMNVSPKPSGKSWEKAPEMTLDTKKSYKAVLTTSKGDMTVTLFDDEAPKTVNNFVFLSREGFYDGVIFHRIIKDFMVQSGDPEGTGRGGPGYRFDDETVKREYKKGTLAMANAGPNTNGSQFFIIHKDYDLPKSYTIFGTIEGSDAASMKTLDAIASTPVETSEGGEQSKPSETVTITKITITEE